MKTLERSFRQEAPNELGVNEQQGKKRFLLTTNSGQQCVQGEEKEREKSLFERPMLPEDETTLVAKYYKRTCLCHN